MGAAGGVSPEPVGGAAPLKIEFQLSSVDKSSNQITPPALASLIEGMSYT